MQNTDLDGSQLIVSWNRYEQGLMKSHLMRCVNSNDIFCFGDFHEVCQLHRSLVRHGIVQQVNYSQSNISQLVADINNAIKQNLRQYTGSRSFVGASDFSINDDKETQFLTKFAMAILDTKKRKTFFPNGQSAHVSYGDNKNNPNCYKLCFDHAGKNYITRAKMKLLSLATQLTRIGLNCKTTINNSNTMRKATQNVNNLKNVNLIDTNNFLDLSNQYGNTARFFNMAKLDIGLKPVEYYENLYRKLFDFAVAKYVRDGQNKKPAFIIPLGGAWGEGLCNYIFTALSKVLGQKTNNKFYSDIIDVKVIDGDENALSRAKGTMPNLQNVGVVNFNKQQPLFNDQTKEYYMIMAGDHCAFLGNEAMYNGTRGDPVSYTSNGQYNDSSMESANMKTDFCKFYGQGQGQPTGYNWQYPQQCGFNPSNGAWIMNPEHLTMPNNYLLHCNYLQDKIYQISSGQSASLRQPPYVNYLSSPNHNKQIYQQQNYNNFTPYNNIPVKQNNKNNYLLNNNYIQQPKQENPQFNIPQANIPQPKNNFLFLPQQPKNNFLFQNKLNNAFNVNNNINNNIINNAINYNPINYGQNINQNFNNQNNKWNPQLNNKNLYVTWNRWGQGLMKKHLIECAYVGDLLCFGDKNEVNELYSKLQKHGLVSGTTTNFVTQVNTIKSVIKSNLKKYTGKKFNGASDYSINDYNETEFLTKFAMAIQDTKLRTRFFPESATVWQSGNMYYAESHGNRVTFQKAKLFTLATLLTRIGINRQTTASTIKNIRNAEIPYSQKHRINVIDTNNFLNCGYLKMSNLIKGLDPLAYYENMYRTLFDFALTRQEQTKGKPPRFLIPLTGFWDDTWKVNAAIRDAVAKLKTDQRYKDIKVDILDYNNENVWLFSSSWPYGNYLTGESMRSVVDNKHYEDYAILSGDHFVFVGNECMNNWMGNGGGACSHEAFSMKTDFPLIYSSQNYGFNPNNGYWRVQENDLNMPTNYNLYLNYNKDKLMTINNTKQEQAKNFGLGFGF